MLRLVTQSAPFELFNGVWRVRLTPDRVEEMINRVTAEYGLHGLPMLWWLTPFTQPTDLRDRLAARGYSASRDVSMAVHRTGLQRPAAFADIRLTRVQNSDDLHTWLTANNVSLGMSDDVVAMFKTSYTQQGFAEDLPLQHYLGWKNDAPVATVSTFAAGGIGGVYNVTTIPVERGQGIGSAITYHAAQALFARGFDLVGLNASEIGCSVYRRLGFVETGFVDTVVVPPVT